MRFHFKTGYEHDINLFKDGVQMFWYALLGVLLLALPALLPDYLMGQMVFILIYVIVGIGLMLLIGFTGQISLGHAAFLAVGAYTEAIMQAKGMPFVVSIVMAALLAGAAGVIVGLPALRLKGIYLGIATMAFGFIAEEVVTRWDHVTGGNSGKQLKHIDFFGIIIDNDTKFYYLALGLVVIILLGMIT